ncbi:MAG: hypothetical protein Q8R09_02455, partial [Anaerolineaceae bacterium]|nr:hypothetical protein [Anaerolineaceae bacterium]
YYFTVNVLTNGLGAPKACPRRLGEQPPTSSRKSPGSSVSLPSSLKKDIISGVILKSMVRLVAGCNSNLSKPTRCCNGTMVEACRSLK